MGEWSQIDDGCLRRCHLVTALVSSFLVVAKLLFVLMNTPTRVIEQLVVCDFAEGHSQPVNLIVGSAA